MSVLSIIGSRAYRRYRLWTFIKDTLVAFALLCGAAALLAGVASFGLWDVFWVGQHMEEVYLACRILFVVALVVAAIIHKQSYEDDTKK